MRKIKNQEKKVKRKKGEKKCLEKYPT